jgi:hypothetical protein
MFMVLCALLAKMLLSWRPRFVAEASEWTAAAG